jgi:hypothetical protein
MPSDRYTAGTTYRMRVTKRLPLLSIPVR